MFIFYKTGNKINKTRLAITDHIWFDQSESSI